MATDHECAGMTLPPNAFSNGKRHPHIEALSGVIHSIINIKLFSF